MQELSYRRSTLNLLIQSQCLSRVRNDLVSHLWHVSTKKKKNSSPSGAEILMKERMTVIKYGNVYEWFTHLYAKYSPVVVESK